MSFFFAAFQQFPAPYLSRIQLADPQACWLSEGSSGLARSSTSRKPDLGFHTRVPAGRSRPLPRHPGARWTRPVPPRHPRAPRLPWPRGAGLRADVPVRRRPRPGGGGPGAALRAAAPRGGHGAPGWDAGVLPGRRALRGRCVPAVCSGRCADGRHCPLRRLLIFQLRTSLWRVQAAIPSAGFSPHPGGKKSLPLLDTQTAQIVQRPFPTPFKCGRLTVVPRKGMKGPWTTDIYTKVEMSKVCIEQTSEVWSEKRQPL